jgi:hypothetical protein
MKVDWGKFWKLFLMIALAGAVATWGLGFVAKVVFSAVIVLGILLGAAVIALFFSLKKAEEAPPQPSPEEVRETSRRRKVESFEKIVQGLICLNIAIRVEGLADDIKRTAESTIDSLRSLIPKMEERYPGEELTWEVTRIATTHLPELLQKFIALRGGERERNRAELLKSLLSMEQELAEITEIIDKDLVGEFGRKAKTVELKYGNGPAA